VNTQLAGVLYLVNLMRQLDLPACFEETWRLASQVGPWGVLELLGRALLGRDAERLANDPLWAVLAALDGREAGELPGTGFRGAEGFFIPQAWLAGPGATASRQRRWAVNGQRLRVWSESGYVLLDLPKTSGPSGAERQAREALRAYLGGGAHLARPVLVRDSFDEAPVDALDAPCLQDLNPSLAWWLARVIPYVRWRLTAALNVLPGELAPTLLLYRGRLYATATHVDVVLDLDDICVPVRLAGLDLNPSWLPDFARVVLFHFE
jgi:hypothetical protein